MNVERLTILKDFLENADIEDDDFSLNDWRCGTVACAIGWAMTIPEFIAQGFHSENYDRQGHSQYPVFNNGEHGRGEGWYAVTAFFDISYLQAMKLFRESSYPDNATRFMVAGRIGQLIDGAMPSVHVYIEPRLD